MDTPAVAQNMGRNLGVLAHRANYTQDLAEEPIGPVMLDGVHQSLASLTIPPRVTSRIVIIAQGFRMQRIN
jgi:hypothetical protein